MGLVHNVIRLPTGGHDPQDLHEEEGVLDIQGHMALGGPKDRPMADSTRGPMRIPHRDQKFPSVTLILPRLQVKYSGGGGGDSLLAVEGRCGGPCRSGTNMPVRAYHIPHGR